MKLGAAEARAALRRPDPGLGAVLLWGEDERVAEARRLLLPAWVGPEGEAEMRLSRLAAGEVRREPALLGDALRAGCFFPGPRAVWLEDATDGLAPLLAAALAGWQEGDARLLVTAGALAGRSALRRLFEGRKGAVAVAFYDDPMSDGEARELIEAARLGPLEAEARDALLGQARALDGGEFRRLLERVALHQDGAEAPLAAAVVEALAPQGEEAGLDDLLLAVTEGRREGAGALLPRVWASGASPVTVALALGRHVRAALALASDPGGPQAGLGRLRPPPGGARRAMLLRAAAWPRERLERAAAAALQLDRELRSSSRAPERALVERAVLRLASRGD